MTNTPFTLPFGFSAQPCPGCGKHITRGQKALATPPVTWHEACWDDALTKDAADDALATDSDGNAYDMGEEQA